MDHRLGFVRVAAASPKVRVGDCAFNVEQMIQLLSQAERQGVSLLVFPELGITGYTCGDLFLQPRLQQSALDGLMQLAMVKSPVAMVCGLPILAGGRLFNCAAVMQGGRMLGLVPKTHMPNYSEYYEKRWFSPGTEAPDQIVIHNSSVPMGVDLVFEGDGLRFGVEICEDLWAPNPPSGRLSQAGAMIMCNPSASNELVSKHQYRTQLIAQQSGRCIAGYLYAGAGWGESTTDVVFGGYTGIYENGRLLAEGQRYTQDNTLTITDVDAGRLAFLRSRNSSFFEGGITPVRHIPFSPAYSQDNSCLRKIDPHPFVPSGPEKDLRLREIVSIQTIGLSTRLQHTGIQKLVVGVSGGLDSALSLLVAAHAFQTLGWPTSSIHALTMPGMGTGARTKNNALGLMEALGCTVRDICIVPAVQQHFADIGQDPETHDVAYENSQARERTQIVMDYANRIGGLALGTGDLSELALGWSTFNGDHMSMYNPNGGVPKTLVKHLVRWLGHSVFGGSISAIVDDILDTPISPELLPSREGELLQRTEDILGAYDLHDFFLYHMLEGGAGPRKLFAMAQIAFDGLCDRAAILKALKIFITRFFSQQFKRNCLPDGPKVGTVSLSPRGDWRMPSDACARAWLDEVRELEG